METKLTDEELLSIYGGVGQTGTLHGLTYVYGIDGTPLQGQAIIALNSGHAQPVIAFDGQIFRPVGVRIGNTIYDLPGDNPEWPGKY